MNPNAISLAKAKAELRRLDKLKRVAQAQIRDCDQKIPALIAAINMIKAKAEAIPGAKADQNAS